MSSAPEVLHLAEELLNRTRGQLEELLASDAAKIESLRATALSDVHALRSRIIEERSRRHATMEEAGEKSFLMRLSVTERTGLPIAADYGLNSLTWMLSRAWSVDRPTRYLPEGFYGEGFPTSVAAHARVAERSAWPLITMLRLLLVGDEEEVMAVVNEVFSVRRLATPPAEGLPKSAKHLLAWRRAGCVHRLEPFALVAATLVEHLTRWMRTVLTPDAGTSPVERDRAPGTRSQEENRTARSLRLTALVSRRQPSLAAGLITIVEASQRYGVPHSTLHSWRSRHPQLRIGKDDDCNVSFVDEEALRNHLESTGKLTPKES